MPYKDKEKQLEYQRKWMQKRRQEFFTSKSCKICESVKDLQLHHRDPNKKEGHQIWSWSEKRRLAELEKCDVLCKNCHVEIHRKMETWLKGESHPQAKLTRKDVVKIKIRLKNKENPIEIARDFNVGRSTIYNIKYESTWSHIQI
jgi:hypothetical protein